MTAVPLFDEPRARRTDPATSKAAAKRMGTASASLEKQIVELLGRHRWALTKDEVCRQLDVHPRRWPSVASALSRMKQAGALEWTGFVVDGQNVWRLREDTVDVQGGVL